MPAQMEATRRPKNHNRRIDTVKSRQNKLCRILAVVSYFAMLAVPGQAWAVVIAWDNAGNSAYAADATNGAWQGQNSNPAFENPAGNDNGGFGFLPWNFAGGSNNIGPVEPYQRNTHFIDGVDFPTTASNNLGTPAFGLGNPGIPYDYDYTAARRPFAQPLNVGDKFSVDIDTPTFDDSYADGEFPALYLEFYDSANTKTVGFWTAATPTEDFDYGWTYTDVGHNAESIPGIDDTNYTINGSTFTLKMTSATTAHVTIGAVGLDVNLLAGVPSSVYFLLGENNSVADGNGNPTGEHAFYFNNLKIETTVQAGDYNGDGKVDAADYVVWRKSPGSFGGAGGYTTWRANYGNPPGAGAGLNSASGVPEPSTALLILSGLVAVSLRRKIRG
jgi:hypothetical protein